MTNEEAIKLIDDRMCFGRGRWSEHHRPVIDEYWQAGEMAIKALEQPKTGKWIKYEQEFMLEGSLGTVQKTVRECSVCTAKIAGMVGIMNFCPNCGVKMEVTE